MSGRDLKKMKDVIVKYLNSPNKCKKTMQDEAINYDQIDSIFENTENVDMIDVWNNSNVLYQSKEKGRNTISAESDFA